MATTNSERLCMGFHWGQSWVLYCFQSSVHSVLPVFVSTADYTHTDTVYTQHFSCTQTFVDVRGTLECSVPIEQKWLALKQRGSVGLHCDWDFSRYCSSTTESGVCQLKSIAKSRPFLSYCDGWTLIHATISSNLIYQNSTFAQLPKKKSSFTFFDKSASMCEKLQVKDENFPRRGWFLFLFIEKNTHTHLISCDERLFIQAFGVVVLLVHLFLLFFVDLQNAGWNMRTGEQTTMKMRLTRVKTDTLHRNIKLNP